MIDNIFYILHLLHPDSRDRYLFKRKRKRDNNLQRYTSSSVQEEECILEYSLLDQYYLMCV